MQQRILHALLGARRAADDDDRRLLGEGLRGGVGDLQSADAVRYADDAEAAQAGVGIGGEAGTLLVAGVDDLQRTLGNLVQEPEHVVTGYTEHVADAGGVQPLDEVFRN